MKAFPAYVVKALGWLKKHYKYDSEVQKSLEHLMSLHQENEKYESSDQGSGEGRPLPAPGPLHQSPFVALYTDGACRGNPGPGGWGLVIQNEDGSVIAEDYGPEKHTTNNRMELTAAIRALSYPLASRPKNTVLVSDSKYVLDGLKSWMDGWKRRGWKKADGKAPENLDLWQELDLLKQTCPGLKTVWVKGHSGHPQNERCDQLANKAIDELIN